MCRRACLRLRIGISGFSLAADVRPSVYPLAYIKRIEIPGCKADLSTTLHRFTRVYSIREVGIIRLGNTWAQIMRRILMDAIRGLITSVYIPVNRVVKLIIQIIVT